MMIANKLECVCRSQKANGNKATVATELAIFIGPLLVASKVVGGVYNATQGLAEYRRNPTTFKHVKGMEKAKLVA